MNRAWLAWLAAGLVGLAACYPEADYPEHGYDDEYADPDYGEGDEDLPPDRRVPATAPRWERGTPAE